jgi:hypothetical protein
MTKFLEPDYTQTVWPTIEAKLGRKMTAEENKKFMYRGGGMFKEWFFNTLKDCTTAEQAEDLLARALQRPWTSKTTQPPPGLLSRLLKVLGL